MMTVTITQDSECVPNAATVRGDVDTFDGVIELVRAAALALGFAPGTLDEKLGPATDSLLDLAP